MTPETIAVFDVLGPMYHYAEEGFVKSAAEGLVAKFEEDGITFSNDNEAAQAEEELQRSGKVKPFIMPGFTETTLYLREKGIRPVVVSAGTAWVLENTVEMAAREYSNRTKRIVNPEQLVEPTDLVSTVPIGSKKTPDTWRKAIEGYGDSSVYAVWEDTLENLLAAQRGFNLRAAQRNLPGTVGFHVVFEKKGLTYTPVGDGTLLYEMVPAAADVYQGHMEEILDYLKMSREKKLEFLNRQLEKYDRGIQ